MDSLSINDHLKLQPISRSFSKEIFTHFSSDIVRYLLVEKPPEAITDTEAFIDLSVSQLKKGTDIVWVILHQQEFIGCCGIHNIPSRKPHFGLWIKKEAQGRGFGSSVTEYCMKWAVKTLDIDYIRYPVDIHNKPSIAVIEKLTPTIHGSYKMGEGKVLEVNEYRLYRE
ncbi:GNAT family N-acetyltransferase [Fulvivirga sedimenti]|uniref:GNAT family N-acetyltransferase n=1 Tax=Fulvivirga sedimenti TaxID=2879465 RepID=A0A9X1HT42_9BACT|nr:GNAT family N-acetyltransferase [Fulvivirga sedimenti]MCA6075155.1 GNAT family N-acetyltransferase [Fulvivirga sedimenti]MCA6076332.1 GNAT family N-acetyltransferase [Fulvivirga sedimenti]MCA6077460.1 GNAT family N-acetyltransferase [Fulvivirga sedimenti]